MAKRSKIDKLLSEEDKQELNRRLLENCFSDYRELSDWLKEKGYEISKSSVHRYGIKLQDQQERYREVREKATAIAETFPDDSSLVALGLNKLAQGKLYEALEVIEPRSFIEEDVVENLPKLIGAITRLNKSSMDLQKYRREVEEKLKQAADQVAEVGRSKGVSETVLDQIKQGFLGVIQ